MRSMFTKLSGNCFVVHLIRLLRRMGSFKEQSVLDWREFQFHLQNEVNRTNRSGSPFTLAVFSVHEKHSNCDELDFFKNHLIQVICERTRQSDVKGFYGSDEAKIAVMLPDTAYEKSLHLIQSIETLFYARLGSAAAADKKIEIICDVYSYPANQAHIHELGSANDPTGKFVSLRDLNTHLSSRKLKEREDVFEDKIAG
ncbi:MAG: hypothetical protein ACP5I1_16780 [Candidatus Hinthialibacter sp.]